MSDPRPGHFAPPVSPLRFGLSGRFELQPGERRLLVDGHPAALGARALDVLITLAAQPDHLISKNELLDRVWPGLVVEEANLQVQISNLRKVLGGDVIATVPGRGYRFVAPTAPAAGAVSPLSPISPAAAPVTPPPGNVRRLFGRDADLARLETLLQPGTCVTLVGAAGVGKTSLARAAAARVDGRCVWVDAAPLTHADQVASALARALDAPLVQGDPAPQLLRAMQGQSLLIVLDNAEHLVAACTALAVLLGTLPGVRLLVTSQLPLALTAERLLRLDPLPLPPPGAHLAEPGDGALALLVDRIAAADRGFRFDTAALAALADICIQLDGLPLALEMAAARVPLMGLQGVRDALAQRFALLSRGQRDAAPRHRTLHNALDWSYRLLSADEQRLFRALGVFAGGFTLDLALAVMSDGSAAPDSPLRWQTIDGLATLADRSLVGVSADDPPRYRLLETMRAFALQALSAAVGEVAAVRRQHAQALAALFWRYQPGDAATEALCLADMENAREAVAWATAHDLGPAAQITARAARLSTFHVWRNECTDWLRALHPAMDGPAGQCLPAEVQATWWTEMARSASFVDDPRAGAAARRALDLWQPLQQPSQALFAAVVWVRSTVQAGDELDQACAALRAQAAALPAASARERFWLHGALTKAALTRGDYTAVLEGRLAEMTLAQELGSDDMVDAAESNVVNALNRLQRHAEAALRAQALLARIDRRNGDANANLPWVLNGLLEALIATGRSDAAQTLVPRAWAACRRFATPMVLPLLSRQAALQGRFEAAARLVGHTRQAFETRGTRLGRVDTQFLDSALRAAQGALGDAQTDALVRQGRLLDDDAAAALVAG